MRTRDEQKEKAVREKAMQLVVKQGFDGFSMQKLAKAAAISPATIYIYFKNREDMLNQLFHEVQDKFFEVALRNFDNASTFEEFLWQQWKNRLHFIQKYPVHYRFQEQFGNSPLIMRNPARLNEFKENMRQFVKKAMQTGEIKRMEPEVFWALSYGPFYALVKFHLRQKSITGDKFTLNETVMKKTFKMTIKALQPE